MSDIKSDTNPLSQIEWDAVHKANHDYNDTVNAGTGSHPLGGYKIGNILRTYTLAEEAYRDILTDLPNSRALNDLMDRLEKRWNEDVTLAEGVVYAIDLTELNMLNNLVGRDKGDEYLKLVAEALSGIIGEEEWVFRLSEGSDELVLVSNHKLDAPEIKNKMKSMDLEVSKKLEALKTKHPERNFGVSFTACTYGSNRSPREARGLALNTLGQAKREKTEAGQRGGAVNPVILQ